MKKTVTAAALIAALTFAGFQMASAHGGRFSRNNGYGPGYCGNFYNGSGYTEGDQAALRKFRTDTAATRREIVVKRSELNALMSNDNPDATKVANLTGEIYDLEADIDSKADAAGIDGRFACGYGPGMMRGYGYGPGMMQDYGRGPGMMRGYGGGPGRHMMGW